MKLPNSLLCHEATSPHRILYPRRLCSYPEPDPKTTLTPSTPINPKTKPFLTCLYLIKNLNLSELHVCPGLVFEVYLF